MKISPYLFSFKSIEIDNASIEELISSKKRSLIIVITFITLIFINLGLSLLKSPRPHYLLTLSHFIYLFIAWAHIRILKLIESKINNFEGKSN